MFAPKAGDMMMRGADLLKATWKKAGAVALPAYRKGTKLSPHTQATQWKRTAHGCGHEAQIGGVNK